MTWSRLKMHIFPLEITKRIYIWTILLIICSHTMLSIGTFYEILIYENHESRERAVEAVQELNKQLLNNSYRMAILPNGETGDNRTNAEKLRNLQQVLQPVLNGVSRSFPEFAMGYYFDEVDGLVEINNEPGSVFRSYLRSMQSVDNGLMHSINTIMLNNSKATVVTYPIIYNGQVIGQVWAYFNSKTVISHVLPKASQVFFTGVFLSGLVLLVQWLLFTRLKLELERFAKAVVTQGTFPEAILPELTPVLQQVKSRASELLEANRNLQQEILKRKEVNKRYQTLASIVESTNDAVIGCANGIITSWNKSAESMYGYTAQEAIGQSISIVVPPERIHEILTTDGGSGPARKLSHYETISVRKDGSVFDVSLSISQIIDDQGKLIGTSTIARDITERKNVERDISRLDRLNLVGQMAAGIGHEIRNPMTTVRGFLQLLGSKMEMKSYREYFNIMISELDRANAIISEYLSMARNKVIDLKLHDLNQTITALFPLIEASTMLSNKTVELRLSEIPKILINEKEIRQVILNLASNGLEAMTEEGKLTIATCREGDEVVLSVKDQGRGIEPGLLHKIGTPFFTTKDKGTGLGLAVCYSIATRHNAVINVDSGKNGTTFYLRFKIHQQGESLDTLFGTNPRLSAVE